MSEPIPPSIRLDQFLKICGITATGGQAKSAIQIGEVSVNGQVETRRRRKLHEGDIVQFGDEEFQVEVHDDQAE